MQIRTSANGMTINGKQVSGIFSLLISGAPVAQWIYHEELYYPLNHIEILQFDGFTDRLRALTVDERGKAFPHLIVHEDSGEPYVRPAELDAWIIGQLTVDYVNKVHDGNA